MALVVASWDSVIEFDVFHPFSAAVYEFVLPPSYDVRPWGLPSGLDAGGGGYKRRRGTGAASVPFQPRTERQSAAAA